MADDTSWINDVWGAPSDVWAPTTLDNAPAADPGAAALPVSAASSDPYVNPYMPDVGAGMFTSGAKDAVAGTDSKAQYGNSTGTPSDAAYAPSASATKGPLSNPSVLSQILQGLGVQNKEGKTDISNPKTMDAVMRLLLGGSGALNSLLGKSSASTYMTPAQMLAANSSPYSKFNPTQQAASDRYFNTPLAAPGARARVSAASMPSSIAPGVGYAHGGNVAPGPHGVADHGPLALVRGPGGGQDDMVDASLSPGEYVFDADTVSALGDGSNDHGAKLLDEMRKHIREHKRSAPADSIPPKAHAPVQYLPQGALSQIR